MYRSDTSALIARRQALEVELEGARREEAGRRSHSLKVLANITVKTPCHESWRRMAIDRSDPRIRHCRRCDNDVYDLSAFDASEVEALIESRGDDLCARFFRRPDGTIMTADCPDPTRPGEPAGRVLAGLCLLLFAFLAAIGLSVRRSSSTMGDVRPATFDESLGGLQRPPADPVDR